MHQRTSRKTVKHGIMTQDVGKTSMFDIVLVFVKT